MAETNTTLYSHYPPIKNKFKTSKKEGIYVADSLCRTVEANTTL